VTIREDRQFGFDCIVDGQLVVGMEFRRGLPIRLTPRQQAQRTYSHRDGVTRETSFEHTLDGVRNRFGGVRIRLGYSGAAFDQAAGDLEGFARPLWGLAPAQAGGASWVDWEPMRRGLACGTNPQHPEYWGEARDYDKRLVRTGSLWQRPGRRGRSPISCP